MIIPMLCVTIFVILVVWFLLPRVARLMIHTPTRSEERFSRNAETDLVCRLLLEKKKQKQARLRNRIKKNGQTATPRGGGRPRTKATDAPRLCNTRPRQHHLD